MRILLLTVAMLAVSTNCAVVGNDEHAVVEHAVVEQAFLEIIKLAAEQEGLDGAEFTSLYKRAGEQGWAGNGWLTETFLNPWLCTFDIVSTTLDHVLTGAGRNPASGRAGRVR